MVTVHCKYQGRRSNVKKLPPYPDVFCGSGLSHSALSLPQAAGRVDGGLTMTVEDFDMARVQPSSLDPCNTTSSNFHSMWSRSMDVLVIDP
ncbi:hypothetical protein LshimejAT787_0405470 [Lyophyllum shimeji]|uniref:Uncharacterized protein n=1 Tax=Lyophyllum shimeji TaxID=47721 RepID=A0A9P3UNP3_LYOSH|nr:hypothetical protein LshimejAT787_0405470 [Lyophyllum shimeji]